MLPCKMTEDGGASARFWEYWNGTWTKITLRPGQRLHVVRGGPTEEGYSIDGMDFTHWPDGQLECHAWSEARDCDGRFDASATYVTTTLDCQRLTDVRDLPDPSNSHRPVTPPTWVTTEEFQRDHSAEAMGY